MSSWWTTQPSQHTRPLSHPYHLYLAPAAIIGVSIACFASILPSVVSSISTPCDGQDLLCPITNFFAQCIVTRLGLAFFLSLLAYVAASITVSNVESSRIFNKPSRIISNPAAAWLAVNCVTGAVVSPVLLSATIKRHSDQERRVGKRTPADLNVQQVDAYRAARHLSSQAETYAISAAVALGFVFPCVILLLHCTPLVVAFWNLFPLYVALVRRTVRRISQSVGNDAMVDTCYAETDYWALLRLYFIPIALSIVAHWHFLYVFLQVQFQEAPFPPALKLMFFNLASMYTSTLYWLFTYGSWSTVLLNLASTILGGPGAGLCIGWIVKERVMVNDSLGSETTPLLDEDSQTQDE